MLPLRARGKSEHCRLQLPHFILAIIQAGIIKYILELPSAPPLQTTTATPEAGAARKSDGFQATGGVRGLIPGGTTGRGLCWGLTVTLQVHCTLHCARRPIGAEPEVVTPKTPPTHLGETKRLVKIHFLFGQASINMCQAGLRSSVAPLYDGWIAQAIHVTHAGMVEQGCRLTGGLRRETTSELLRRHGDAQVPLRHKVPGTLRQGIMHR